MGFLSKTGHLYRYNSLKEFAKENRKNMTLAESVLWNALRDEFTEFKFRRQHPIGDYIADFMCLSQKLVVEVDGGYHSEPRQQHDYEVRTYDLETIGYKVIRFSNEEVLYDTEKVIKKIENQLLND